MTHVLSGDRASETAGNFSDSDGRSGSIPARVRGEFNDLRESMLSDEKRKRLSGLPFPFRLVIQWWWLLRALFLNLSPTRRILLMAGIVLSGLRFEFSPQPVTGWRLSGDLTIVGLLSILFVLMLELKDKLLAKSELQDGRSVQRALMPERSPEIAGWRVWLFTRPANDVGGDLVDCIPLDHSGSAILLADVAGKGLKAALLMAKLQATIRALVPLCRSNPQLLHEVNQALRRDNLPQFFASLVYLQLQPGEASLRAVNAGHPPPIVVRQGGIEQLGKGGPALGLMQEAEYDEKVIELARGEIVLLYTDGLTEAQNPMGDFFGEDRLRSVILARASQTPAELGERLVSACDLFQEPGKAHDDLSLVILQRV